MDSRIVVGIIAVVAVIGAIVLIGGGEPEIATEPNGVDDTMPEETATPEPGTDPADDELAEAAPEPDTTDGESVVDVAAANENLSTLVTAVTEAGITDILATEGPFTVFAPTDAAFDALPEGSVDELLLPENNEQLQMVLASHVVMGVTGADDLEDGMTVTTLSEEELEVSVAEDGTISVGGSTVTESDVEASNGVIHVIDSVIEDPS